MYHAQKIWTPVAYMLAYSKFYTQTWIWSVNMKTLNQTKTLELSIKACNVNIGLVIQEHISTNNV